MSTKPVHLMAIAPYRYFTVWIKNDITGATRTVEVAATGYAGAHAQATRHLGPGEVTEDVVEIAP